MIVKTDARFWDCECDNNYIHKKSITLKCNRCGMSEGECSDSRPNEIKLYYKNYKESDNEQPYKRTSIRKATRRNN